jgi:probable F420-dependent oxidoreductase
MRKPLRFGVVSSGAPSYKAWVTLARRVEELGYASLLMPDRLATPLAPFTALALAAEATTTLRVGSHVFANDYRHPAMLAKEAATLDLLSRGRFELGLGAGVGQPDYQQMGLPLESAGTRVSRVEEALHIIKQCFTEEVVNFSGKYYTITDLRGLPKPIQKPHPPIFIGSMGKRMLSIAAREADSIAPEIRPTPPGSTEADATIEEKLAWIREAAGERIEQLELCQTIYSIAITDSRSEAVPQPWSSLRRQEMSTEQAVAHLQEQHERYGFSYFHVFEGQMENFAPVVARLAGKYTAESRLWSGDVIPTN